MNFKGLYYLLIIKMLWTKMRTKNVKKFHAILLSKSAHTCITLFSKSEQFLFTSICTQRYLLKKFVFSH